MKGFFQLPALRCCMAIVLMVFTTLVFVLKVDCGFNGLRPPEQGTPLNFHKDVVRAHVETLTPFITSL